MSPPWAPHLLSDLSLLLLNEQAAFDRFYVRLKLVFLSLLTAEPLKSCLRSREDKRFQNGEKLWGLSTAVSPEPCLSSKPNRGLRVNIPFCHKF